MKNDLIKHPSHYTQCKYECWDVYCDVLQGKTIPCDVAALVSNAFKYLWRCDCKAGDYGKNQEQKNVEDLKKVLMYLNKAITRVPDTEITPPENISYKYDFDDVAKEVFDNKNFSKENIDLLKSAFDLIWHIGDTCEKTVIQSLKDAVVKVDTVVKGLTNV